MLFFWFLLQPAKVLNLMRIKKPLLSLIERAVYLNATEIIF